MRPGQNRRMRGRNNNNNNNNNGNRKSPNPLQRSYESNGPDVKVRGTAQHVAEKYLQLARDAQSSGDPVAAENYFQHAEHYYRILLAAQEQMSQQFGHSFQPNRAFVEDPDDDGEEGDEMDGGQQGQHQQPNGQHAGGEDGEGGQSNGQRFEQQGRRERNFDRQQDRQQDRGERGPRRFDRPERAERGERRFERQDGGQPQQQQPYQMRPEAQPGAEQPDLAPAQPAGERRERPARSERPARRQETQAAETEQDGAGSLPAFLTMPTRVPIAVSEAPDAEAEPVTQAGEAESEGEAGEKPKRTRRRRSPREVMDALGAESETPAE